MTKAKLKKAVEDLGKTREAIGKLQVAERELTKAVRAALQEKKGKGPKAATSKTFQAILAGKLKTTVDLAKLRRALPADKAFLLCVRPDVKAARRELKPAVFKRISTETDATPEVRVSRIG